MSAALINTKVTEAVAAWESGDTATALSKLRSAKMLLAGIPDTDAADGLGLTWDRAAIDSLIADIKQSRAAAVGVQRTKITYTGPTT